MSDDNKPTFNAYHVQENRNGKSHFHKIGAAFAHKDGEGHDIQLQSVPIDFKGRITIRTTKERLEAKKQKRESLSYNNHGRDH